MADRENTKRRLTAEEIEELIKDIAEDPETDNEESEQPIQSTGNPMFDRWLADNDSINKYGL